jgi:hypothetical protein
MKGGVLIIGSLLWDNGEREKWRQENLNLLGKFQVYLPIRYGRKSGPKRNSTHTMVFSNKCYSKRYGVGTGWVVPLVTEIDSIDGLKDQASKMGKVEGIPDGFSSSWGIVAIKFNPYRNTEPLKQEWCDFISHRIEKHEILSAKLKTEKAAVNSKGLLTIKWSRLIDQSNISEIKGIDFLIATATVPTISKNRYPTSHVIADTMTKANYTEYFDQNRKNGIITFQDQRISGKINRLKSVSLL